MSNNDTYYQESIPVAFDIFNINESFVEYVNKYREDIPKMCNNILALVSIMSENNLNVEFEFTNLKCQLGNINYKLKLERYLRENIAIKDAANPLYFNPDLNGRFNDRIAPYLFDELSVACENTTTNEIVLSDRLENDLVKMIPSDVYTFMYVKDVEVYNVESQIQQLIIDDFLRVNGKNNNQENERPQVFLKHKGFFKQDKVSQVNKKYNSIFTSFCPKSYPKSRTQSHRKSASDLYGERKDSEDDIETIKPKKMRVGSEAVEYNPTNAFYGDVQILLLNADLEKKKIPLDFGYYDMMRNNSNSRSAIQINSLYSTNREKERKFEDFTLKQSKYQNLIDTPKTIDFDSIKYLHDKVDIDGDGQVSLKDQQRFIKKHNIEISTEDTELMIQKANYRKKKPINFVSNMSLMEPITVKDLYYEMKFKLKIVQDQKKFIFPEFYENWMILLNIFGRGTTVKKLDSLKTKPIRPNYEHHKDAVLRKTQSHIGFRNTAATMQSSFYNTQSTIADIPKKFFQKRYKPEAGIIMNNTNYIQEKRNYDSHAPYKIDPIEKVVNNKFLPISSKRPNATVKFNTKRYYNEGVRISQYPPLVKDGSLHPIYRYTPAMNDIKNDNKPNFVKDQVMETQEGQSRMTIPSVVFGRKIDSLLNFDNADSSQELKDLNKDTSLRSFDHSEADKAVDHNELENERPAWWDAKLPPYIPEEEAAKRKKAIFKRHFKERTINEINQKLSLNQFKERKINALEPGDIYKSNKLHQFREEVLDYTKPVFLSRIKSEAGLKPSFSGINEPMPKEILDKLKKAEMKAKLLEQDKDETVQKPIFQSKFAIADKLHMIGDYRAFPFLEKGMFDEDVLNQVDIGNVDQSNKEQFKLFHRTLYCKDRTELAGEN